MRMATEEPTPARDSASPPAPEPAKPDVTNSEAEAGGSETRTASAHDAPPALPSAPEAPPAAPGGHDAPPAAPSAAQAPFAPPRAPEAPPASPSAHEKPPAALGPARPWHAEPEEVPVTLPRTRLAAQSRRDFLLFGLAAAASAVGAWWLLPDRARNRLAPGPLHDRLDALAGRIGLTRARRERTLDRALTFDDVVAEALFSKDRRVRTYTRAEVTPLRNNYAGQTPGPEYLATWTLRVAGLASSRTERLTIADLLQRFPRHEQVTRLVCVEGWSAVAWWQGIRFRDFLDAFPPAVGARWAALRSAVNLDAEGNQDPYFVSIDLETARHPQALLATHQNGRPLTVAHGAPLRLVVPMKLGLKHIKGITDIAYGATEPADYWNQQGYSRYDGL